MNTLVVSKFYAMKPSEIIKESTNPPPPQKSLFLNSYVCVCVFVCLNTQSPIQVQFSKVQSTGITTLALPCSSFRVYN